MRRCIAALAALALSILPAASPAQLTNPSAGVDPTAWSTYSPTVTCGSGALGSTASVGRFKRVGTTVQLWTRVQIVDLGSCATDVRITVPITSRNTGTVSDYQALAGAEVQVVGKSLRPVLMNNSNLMLVTNFDGTFAAANGYIIVVSGSYEVAP